MLASSHPSKIFETPDAKTKFQGQPELSRLLNCPCRRLFGTVFLTTKRQCLTLPDAGRDSMLPKLPVQPMSLNS